MSNFEDQKKEIPRNKIILAYCIKFVQKAGWLETWNLLKKFLGSRGFQNS